MRFFNHFMLLGVTLLLLSGCINRQQTSAAEFPHREEMLLKLKNYNELIAMYRNRLNNDDTPASRLKLSHYYYLAGDYQSSLHYLQPLNRSNDARVDILQVKNMIALGDYGPALNVADRVLQHQPDSAEACNLRGVALALTGRLGEGKRSIEKSRELFIADEIAINNLAMIEIIAGRYQEAAGLLLPHYLRGKKQSEILHNLVLSLVKSGQWRYARNIGTGG